MIMYSEDISVSTLRRSVAWQPLPDNDPLVLYRLLRIFAVESTLSFRVRIAPSKPF